MRSAEAFWARVVKGEGCWEWTGAHLYRRNGTRSYGSVAWEGTRQVGAHRVSYELTNGPIPDGLYVLHKCDNQGCVRPDHLYVGSHRDNTRDAIERRRMYTGERTWNHKLTVEAVRAIRDAIATGEATESIGRRFGISGRTVRYIRRGERWVDAA